MSWDVWHVPLNSAECRRVLFLLWDDMMRGCWGPPIKLWVFHRSRVTLGRMLMQSSWELINRYSLSRSIKHPSSSPSISQPLHRVARCPPTSLGQVPNLLTCTLTHELWASVYPPSERHSEKEYHELFTDLATTRNANVFRKIFYDISIYIAVRLTVKAYIIYVSHGHDITGTRLQNG